MFRGLASLFLGCMVVAACDDPVFPAVDVSRDGGARPLTPTDGGPDSGNTLGPLDATPPDPTPPPDATQPPDAGSPPECAAQVAKPSAVSPTVTQGDFDQDGEPDVVVGDPSDNEKRGAVCFFSGALWKSTDSLGTCRRWTQLDDTTSGSAEPGDACGAALAVGDFDGDGVDDLAIGCPGEGFQSDEPEAGQLTIVFGKAGFGPDFSRTQTLHQANFDRDREASDLFTMSLAAADFDADGISDLAMAAPNESVGAIPKAGVVMVLSGKASFGLDPATYVGIGQGSFQGLDLPGAVVGRDDTYEAGDLFGSALAVANLSFAGVVRPTLIIGVPGEDNGKGVVQLLAGGTGSGLAVPTARAVLSAPAAAGAGFGRALAGMGSDRVLVGAPYAHESAGAVWVFDIDAENWATPSRTELRKAPLPDDGPKPNDFFGYSLFTTSGSLLVGTPGEDHPNSKLCNEGSVERFDSALQGKPALVEEGRAGFGTMVSGFEGAAGSAFALVRASDTSVVVRALTDPQ